jgi:hypothetical protein
VRTIGRLLRLASLALLAIGGCGGDVVPSLTLSVRFADGRSCRDASVTRVQIVYGATPQSFICVDAEAPRAVTATMLPLSDALDVDGLSAEGARLYRGRLVAADVLAAPAPIVLDPWAAR